MFLVWGLEFSKAGWWIGVAQQQQYNMYNRVDCTHKQDKRPNTIVLIVNDIALGFFLKRVAYIYVLAATENDLNYHTYYIIFDSFNSKVDKVE